MIKLSNGYLMPKIGLGTFLMNDEAETYQTIINAIEAGYRHFDTAQMYGNEKVIGDALKASNIDRSEVFITTKLMNHHSYEKTKELILNSLKDLQTDYLDLLLIHWPNHDRNVNTNTWKVFEEFYEKGIVKAIGVSNFTRFQLLELMETAKVIPHVNQVEQHLNLPQVPLKQFLDKHNIKMIGYGPLMRGNLFNDYFKKLLEPVASKYNISLAQLVLAWGLAKDVIMIPKTVTKARLYENIASVNVKLSEEDIKLLDSVNNARRYYGDPSNNEYGKFIK